MSPRGAIRRSPRFPWGLASRVTGGLEPPPDVQVSNPTADPPSFSYFCPSVQLVDPNGVAVSVANVPVSITASPDPGLYFGTTQFSANNPGSVLTNSSGTAVFGTISGGVCTSGLAATVKGPQYTLTASSPAAVNTVNSSQFAVVQVFETCTNSCTAKLDGSSGTAATIVASQKNTTFPLSASFGLGLLLTCDSSVSTLPADPLVVTTGTTPASGTVTMTFPKSIVNSVPDNGAPHMPVCSGSKVPFYGSNTAPLNDPNYPYQGV